MHDPHPSQTLAAFAATPSHDQIPPAVRRRTEDLFLDWMAWVLAGKGARPVEALARFWLAQGPADGPAEVLIHRRGSSPLVAAAINAAASHVAEQDDVHNGSVFHPAAVEFPVALAAAVGRLLGLSQMAMRHAFGSAGTQAAGLWEFLRDAADSEQLHTAHAASTGLAAAVLAAETSFKWHASCRHTHPAADALRQVMQTHGLAMADIEQVTALVHQGAIDVLGPVTDPQTVHQSKFSMGTVLAQVAQHGHAGLPEFDAGWREPPVPARWLP